MFTALQFGSLSIYVCNKYYSPVMSHFVFFLYLFLQILSHNILVVMAIMFPNDFTPEVHVALDKFLAALSRALAEKYR